MPLFFLSGIYWGVVSHIKMTRNIIYISLIFLIFPLRLIGQENNECEQFIKAYEYVEINILHKEFKKERKLQIDTIVQNWTGIPFMTSEYYAYEMGITETEFQKLDTAIRLRIYRKNQENLLRIDSTYSSDCIKTVNYKRPNLILSFTRINDKSISIWISKIRKNPKKHTSGKYLIFIFNGKNQIEKVFETGWTE